MGQNKGIPNRKPRICMVVGAYYPQISGGAIQCHYLLKAMPEKERFTVIASYKTGLDMDERALPVNDMIDGVRVFRLKIDANNPLSKLAALARLAKTLFLSSGRIDILHIHGMSAKNVAIILMGKLLNKKMVIKMASFGQDDPESLSRKSPFAFKAYSLSDAFVSTTPAFSMSYRSVKMPEAKMFEIPNGVDLDLFKKPSDSDRRLAKEALGISANMRVILFVGFFSKDKALDLYMDSLKLLTKESLANMYFIFIGSKNESEVEVEKKVVDKVFETIGSLGLRNRSLLVDPTNDIVKYYMASDIFVFPSRREGMPNVLLEAMASGLCVISSRIRGITDYIVKDNVTGLLFDKDDANTLAEKLTIAIRDADLCRRLGENARIDISERFDIRKVAGLYERLYEKITGG